MTTPKMVETPENMVLSALEALNTKINKTGKAHINPEIFHWPKFLGGDHCRHLTARLPGWRGVKSGNTIVMDLTLEYVTKSKSWRGYWNTYENFGRFGQGSGANPAHIKAGLAGVINGSRDCVLFTLFEAYTKLLYKGETQPYLAYLLYPAEERAT